MCVFRQRFQNFTQNICSSFPFIESQLEITLFASSFAPSCGNEWVMKGNDVYNFQPIFMKRRIALCSFSAGVGMWSSVDRQISCWICQWFKEWQCKKAVAPHSSTLAWKIPWMEEPGRLQSMGSLRVKHDWVTSLSLFTFTHWRRKWQPTPVFLPGESQGWRSLVGCHL